MKKINHFMNLAVMCILFSIIFIGCGSGGGGGSGDGISDSIIIKEGQFLDSAVSGLEYSSGNQSGNTDLNGTFKYEEGKKIKFFIGDIILGEANGKPIITPVDLGPNGIISDQKVINISRFFLTLDFDKDPNNGIEIPAEAQTKATGISIEFDVSKEVFEESNTVKTFISQVANTSNLVSSDFAQDHLQETVNTIRSISGYSGRWSFNEIVTGSYGECTDDIGGQSTSIAQLEVMENGNASFTILFHTEASEWVMTTYNGKIEKNKLTISGTIGYNCGPSCEIPCENGQLSIVLTFSDKDNATGTMKTDSCCPDGAWSTFSITGKRVTSASITSASINNFVGRWIGNYNLIFENNEEESDSLILTLSINNNNSLDGTWEVGIDEPVNISGTVSSGIFTFDIPNSDPTNPDCANWDFSAIATLNNSESMTLNALDTLCGAGGGTFGNLSATLMKSE